MFVECHGCHPSAFHAVAIRQTEFVFDRAHAFREIDPAFLRVFGGAVEARERPRPA
jgi:hypothetical protein